LPPSRSELLLALSQPMALALELGRLGRVAQRAAQDRAVLAERNRMARDVHDTLAQGFGAISLQLQAAARATSEEERARFVARATQEAQANLVESRHTIRLLRGMAGPGEAAHALVHVIEDALASRLRGSPLSWRVLPLPDGLAEPPLDEDTRRELKRIAQEAATNALKHASASLFEARIEMRPDGGLALRLVDHGCGFDPKAARDGFGLMGMRERAVRIGATLRVESQPGGPTAVVVLLPPATTSPSAGSQGAR
jgi:signal transduction histidine kinase